MSSVTVHVLVKLFVKLGTALLIGPAENLSCIFSSATLNSETVLGFRWRFQNSFVRHFADTISISFKYAELLSGYCSFSSTCGQLPWRNCWEIGAMRAERHASRWICRSICQQSVALFNELWEQKLINNFNYCLQQN